MQAWPALSQGGPMQSAGKRLELKDRIDQENPVIYAKVVKSPKYVSNYFKYPKITDTA